MTPKKHLVVLIVFILGFISAVFSDGAMFTHDPAIDRWLLMGEEHQMCIINYKNGIQKMLLSVDASGTRGDKAVWLFPVPAKPEKTAIDVVNEFPIITANDIKEKARRKIPNIFSFLRSTQIYTKLFPIIYATLFPEKKVETFYAAPAVGASDEILVYGRIEKFGLTTELVSTKKGKVLQEYLKKKGLNLPVESINIMDEYIGKEYIFVISWISNFTELTKHSSRFDLDGNKIVTVSILISFPTKKIFFPLRPTSLYGSVRIPILLWVTGYVTPEIYPAIKQDTQVSYHFSENYYVSADLSYFFNSKNTITNFRYTKIEINVPSKFIKDDLWIRPVAPLNVTIADFVYKNVIVTSIILLILCSCPASLLSGIIVFRKDKLSLKKLILFKLFGLLNLTTLIGFSIATLLIPTRRLSLEQEQQLRAQGLSAQDFKKIPYIILFSVLFLLFTYCFQFILKQII